MAIYTLQVGSDRMSLPAGSAPEAINKAVAKWNDKHRHFTRWHPDVHILGVTKGKRK